jgi:hypothetical protein
MMVTSVAEYTGSAGADLRNIGGAKSAKFKERIRLAEDHNRGELVVDHHRSGIELMTAIRVNRGCVVRYIVPIVTMMPMSEMGRNVHATNICAEAGIRGANDRRSTVESEVISHGGETQEGGEQCRGRQSDIHFEPFDRNDAGLLYTLCLML